MKNYRELREELSEKIGKFPIFWAFSEQQFTDGCKKLNCIADDLVRVTGGGFIRKDDIHLYRFIWVDYEKKLNALLATSEGFIDAVYYELCNHEYSITDDGDIALNALGLEYNKLTPDQKQWFIIAAKKCRDNSIF